MKLPFQTKWERNIAIGLVVLWALLFLPNLRTNPNWYGDEGEWMEKWLLVPVAWALQRSLPFPAYP